ncbi:MAG: protein kinase [Cyanobacteria bacterium P01_E01_bin.6]
MPSEPLSVSIRGQRALAAIVLTDGVGFSARMSVDEELTLQLIHRDLRMMQKLCEEHEGHVLKSTGDGLLMYFVSAVQAVQCSLTIQQQLIDQAKQYPDKESLSHRIGIHLGDVFLSESDVMGNGVNIAARLQTKAEPGGICISQTVYDVVKSRLSLSTVYLGSLHLKNIQETVAAHHIVPTNHSQAVNAHSFQASTSSSRSQRVMSTSEEATIRGSQSDHVQGESLSNTRNVPQADIEPGQMVHNRYRIERVLGQGGFGRTYLAHDTHRFDDLCVLKEFLPLNRSDYVVEKSRSLFEREAKTLYQINHPQIPRFLAWFTHNRRLFIVQEYIDGQTYSHVLRDRQMLGQRFTESEVIQWLQDLLDVLSYIHSKGIVHRDISPDNIMLPQNTSQVDHPKPVLIDFGLVKQTVSQMWKMSPSELNGSHSFVGKLGYAPPEQIRMGQCFPASDLYALGVTAIVLLTGCEPNVLMDQESLEWNWRSHIHVSDSFAQILDIMLAEKPKNRYESAQDALAALRHIIPGSSDANDNVTPRHSTSPTSASMSSAHSSSRSNATPSASSPSSLTLTPAILELYQQELMSVIGPVASYVVAETYGKHPNASPAQLMNLLAQEIPNQQQVSGFKQKLKQAILKYTSTIKTHHSTPAPSSSAPSSSLNPNSAHLSQPSSRPLENSTQEHSSSQRSSASVSKQTISSIRPEFVERCRSELARCIGPMASYILDDVLTDAQPSNAQQLVRAIAAEIPDPKKANAFKQALL